MVFFWKKAASQSEKQSDASNNTPNNNNSSNSNNNNSSSSTSKHTEARTMDLPTRGAPPPYSPSSDSPSSSSLTLHPSTTPPGLLVKLTPPQTPPSLVQVGCDIVLVIDVSGSMGTSAPVPGDGANEDYGLSVLDLVKHAARTIAATLNEGDRLGIVAFASKVTVLQGLTPMTAPNKKITEKRIDEMRPLDCTNLWHGIKEGLELFEGASGRVPAVMVLTDGMPNISCPSKGYVPKLRAALPLPASIHTFGFGYSLRSGLLKSIAEIGGGNYAFIPDAGMIGTVFVHAVANLQSTYATAAALTLTYPAALALEETTGISVERTPQKDADDERKKMVIKLGNVQYGQSRDVWLSAAPDFDPSGVIVAGISYTRVGHSPTIEAHSASTTLSAPTNLSPDEMQYHRGRSALISFLGSLFPIDSLGEHKAVTPDTASKLGKDALPRLISELSSSMSLLHDIRIDDAPGQVEMALTPTAYSKWGVHFLPSLANAHFRQVCNSFKDPGPLAYCTQSPLFIECRDRLDDMFDNLPPPKPSIHQRYVSSGAAISMSSYNTSAGVCFAGDTLVRLASGRTKPIRSLRRHDSVETPLGPRDVVAILRTRVRRYPMARVNNLLVTLWHPISTNTKSWEYPASIPSHSKVRYTGCIYSVLLEPDDDAAAHAIRVNDFWGVTLGHGMVGGVFVTDAQRNDKRTHAFFGSYVKVARALQRLDIGVNGMIDGGGVKRDQRTRLVVGFKKARPQEVRPDEPGPEEAALELALMLEGKDVPEQTITRPRARARARAHRSTVRNAVQASRSERRTEEEGEEQDENAAPTDEV